MKELKNILLSSINPNDVPEDLKKYFEITLAFQKLFISNLENIGARTVQLKKAKFNWIIPVKRMIEIDEVTIDELKEVYSFLKNHKFWTKNIVSTSKLRQQFDVLHAQLKSEKNKVTKFPDEWDNSYARKLDIDQYQKYTKHLYRLGFRQQRSNNNTKWIK